MWKLPDQRAAVQTSTEQETQKHLGLYPEKTRAKIKAQSEQRNMRQKQQLKEAAGKAPPKKNVKVY